MTYSSVLLLCVCEWVEGWNVGNFSKKRLYRERPTLEKGRRPRPYCCAYSSRLLPLLCHGSLLEALYTRLCGKEPYSLPLFSLPYIFLPKAVYFTSADGITKGKPVLIWNFLHLHIQFISHLYAKNRFPPKGLSSLFCNYLHHVLYGTHLLFRLSVVCMRFRHFSTAHFQDILSSLTVSLLEILICQFYDTPKALPA